VVVKVTNFHNWQSWLILATGSYQSPVVLLKFYYKFNSRRNRNAGDF